MNIETDCLSTLSPEQSDELFGARRGYRSGIIIALTGNPYLAADMISLDPAWDIGLPKRINFIKEMFEGYLDGTQAIRREQSHIWQIAGLPRRCGACRFQEQCYSIKKGTPDEKSFEFITE